MESGKVAFFVARQVLEALANPCHEEVTRVMRVQCVATQEFAGLVVGQHVVNDMKIYTILAMVIVDL